MTLAGSFQRALNGTPEGCVCAGAAARARAAFEGRDAALCPVHEADELAARRADRARAAAQLERDRLAAALAGLPQPDVPAEPAPPGRRGLAADVAARLSTPLNAPAEAYPALAGMAEPTILTD